MGITQPRPYIPDVVALAASVDSTGLPLDGGTFPPIIKSIAIDGESFLVTLNRPLPRRDYVWFVQSRTPALTEISQDDAAGLVHRVEIKRPSDYSGFLTPFHLLVIGAPL